ncbi:DUF2970 domain-containing protein [Aliiglaciecola sp. M165]|nr:DUF2970 domain-containing protein [Aliiglaciecola sp. M165]
MFGVQTHKNYEHDFKQKSFIPFLLVGIVFVIGLVVGLLLLVKFILA